MSFHVLVFHLTFFSEEIAIAIAIAISLAQHEQRQRASNSSSKAWRGLN
jgi:hypothetical protein